MIDPIYYLDRIIMLTITSIFIIIVTIQIYTSRTLRVFEMKHFAHYLVLINTFTLLICYIDIANVFGVFHPLFYVLVRDFGGQLTLVEVCLVITAHFRAHYLSLKQEFPSYLTKLLIFPLITGFILNYIGNILVWKYNVRRYMIIIFLNTFYECGFIAVLDLIGYYKIRKLLIEAKNFSVNRNNSKQIIATPQVQTVEEIYCLCLKRPIQQTQEIGESKKGVSGGGSGGSGDGRIDYNALLNKIWKFHLVIVILCAILFLLTGMQFTELSDLDAPPVGINPNVWSFEYNIHSTLLSQFLFCWWGWIPFCIRKNGSSHSNQSMTGRSTHLSRSDAPAGRYQNPSRPDSPSPIPEQQPLQEKKFPDDHMSSSTHSQSPQTPLTSSIHSTSSSTHSHSQSSTSEGDSSTLEFSMCPLQEDFIILNDNNNNNNTILPTIVELSQLNENELKEKTIN